MGGRGPSQLTPAEGPEYVHTELVLLIHTVKPEHFGLH